MICIVIISIPFLIAAGIGGYIFAKIIEKRRIRMGYSIHFYYPYWRGCRSKIPTPSRIYEVKTVVIINAKPETVWKNVVRVKRSARRIQKGIF